MKNWFNGWQWLKCTGGEWNFARMMAFGLSVVQVAVIIAKIENFVQIQNLYQLIAYCSPFVAAILFYFFEILRENKKIQLKIGNNSLKME
ncbi:MAG: hypothetical protein LBN27_05050 [Prevotellaceae bacterium]|jgi:hypothetical protein|nr:hypothetical protein [Prevotellaceae bacterium]